MRRRALLATLLTMAVVTIAVGPAAAGEYPVFACDPAHGDVNHSWTARTDHRFMAAYGNCPPPWGETNAWNQGLVTRHVPTGGAAGVGLFNHGGMFFHAPPGAGLARVFYTHTFCGNGGFQAGLANAWDQWLHFSGPGFCGSPQSNPNTLQLNGTPELRLYTICAALKCDTEGPVHAWATLRTATVTVVDWTVPSVSGSGPLTAGGWVRGDQVISVSTSDNVGVKRVEVWLDDKLATFRAGACDYTYVIPCSMSGEPMSARTGAVSDGAHRMRISAIDSAENVGDADYTVKLDNTAPPGPRDVRLVGASDWRATNDFSVGWTNPAQSAAPIAGMRYALCPVSTPADAFTGCNVGSRAGTNIASVGPLSVPGLGQWSARIWLVDAAGNEEPLSAQSIPFRFDNVPPEATLAEADAEDPQRITVIARDATSGLAGGDIEIRRAGTDRWISLPVDHTTIGITAVVDDAALQDGVYDVRARVIDQAGNERSTTTRASGSAAHLVLPLRVPTSLTAGRRQVRGSHGHHRTVLVKTATTAFGSSVQVHGRLTVPGGNPLAAVDVDVLEHTELPDQPWIRAGVTRTDGQGRFTYRVLPGPNRTVLFRYAGSRLIRPRTTAVRVRVRAATSLRVDRHSVVNGEEVTFRGRVAGGPLPTVGKLIQLQAYSRSEWRTFATPRARSRSHRWSYRYRFSATRGTVRYRFRAVVPAEGGYPFVRGSSRSLDVTVRGL